MNAQEHFWRGEFGDEYSKRCRVAWEERIPFWRSIMEVTRARSVLDVGCNAGWNQRAIREVDATIRTVGIDVNDDALHEARAAGLNVVAQKAREAHGVTLGLHEKFDLVCTSGVLIHVGPEELRETMESIIAASKRWVLAVEYDSEKEEEVIYRGHSDRLWKRPFGKMYEERGLSTVAVSDPAGFDRCRAWLLVKS